MITAIYTLVILGIIMSWLCVLEWSRLEEQSYQNSIGEFSALRAEVKSISIEPKPVKRRKVKKALGRGFNSLFGKK